MIIWLLWSLLVIECMNVSILRIMEQILKLSINLVVDLLFLLLLAFLSATLCMLLIIEEVFVRLQHHIHVVDLLCQFLI